MEIEEYIIVSATHGPFLQKEVNEKIKQGYQPYYGGFAADLTGEKIFQPMVKYKKEKTLAEAIPPIQGYGSM